MGTGLGTAIDVAGVLLLGAVVLGLATLILLLVLALTRRMPLRFKALVIVAFGSLIASRDLSAFRLDSPCVWADRSSFYRCWPARASRILAPLEIEARRHRLRHPRFAHAGPTLSVGALLHPPPDHPG